MCKAVMLASRRGGRIKCIGTGNCEGVWHISAFENGKRRGIVLRGAADNAWEGAEVRKSELNDDGSDGRDGANCAKP